MLSKLIALPVGARRRVPVALVAAVTLSVGLATPALAAGGPPIHRIYDCYGALTYVQALELKTKTTYLVAPYRKGNHLSGRAAKGTYRLRHGKLTFRSGPYAKIHWYGKWVRKRAYPGGGDLAHIALFAPKRHQEVLDCYPH